MSVTDFTDFVPIREVTVDDIRARFDADVNAGRVPGDPDYWDTVDGGWYSDLRNACALAFARLYDFLAGEVVASMFPATTFGQYLDRWGETLQVPRKDEVKATGEVTFEGIEGFVIPSGTKVSTVQTDTENDPISFVTTEDGTITGGEITVGIEAEVAGSAGNVGIGTITILISPIGDSITSLTNEGPTSSGSEVESDELYSARIILEFEPGQGAGTQNDYRRWALAFPGVGFATVEPFWAGPGTVRVTVTDQFNNPVSGAVVSGLQTLLDPIPGEGEGLAPVGASVTVATPTVAPIVVAGSPVFKAGYTLDGDGGTIATRAQIEAALRQYVDRLAPGDDVIRERTIAQFFTVVGVLDVTGVTLNGSGTNFTISSTEVARMSAATLT